MMERNRYNSIWADKLQEVSIPDVGEAWMSMELILDKEMPSPGTNDRRRWLLLILLLLLLIGVCNCPGRGRWFDFIRTGSPAPTASVPAHTPSTATTSPATPTTATPTTATPAAATPSDPNSAAPTPASSTPAVPTPAIPTLAASTPPVRTSAVPTPVSTMPAAPMPAVPTPDGPTSAIPTRAAPALPTAAPGVPAAGTPSTTPNTTSMATTPSTKPPLSPPVPFPTVTLPSDTATLSTRAPSKTDKRSATPPASTRTDSAHRKPLSAPEDSAETVKGFMAGLGLNQFFPIGGQTSSGYNSSGISGTLSDYIPIPMVRYYFSSKLFVQLEAQFNTPQYTKSNLEVSKTVPDSSTVVVRTVSTVVSLKKLFYFNIPLSVHYNLSDHFSLGAGLQFSRLTNAIGFFDNTTLTPGGPDTVNTETKSFKEDSIYQRIKTDEFRFLVDFGYTWKHFIVGLRYNQALSKFINVQVAPGQITQGRNSSLQLYLRYILWDGRKKKRSGGP